MLSQLTFDYRMQFSNNAEFAKAVAELLQTLNEEVWLVGQSLGGIVAQIIAKNYPQNMKGLVLSNTCSLSKNKDKEAYDHLQEISSTLEACIYPIDFGHTDEYIEKPLVNILCFIQDFPNTRPTIVLRKLLVSNQ